MAQEDDSNDFSADRISYIIESAIYALAMLLGLVVCCYTVRRFNSTYRRHPVLAARLVKFKISLTVADLIVLYIYAPTQIIWIIAYNWYGGDFLCRTTKFINTFSLHLTANMQMLIAADRLYITAHLRQIHQKSHFETNKMIACAWLLAITCALPQLFVFHVYILPNGSPQCVSIWTVMRFREYARHVTEVQVSENATLDIVDNFNCTKEIFKANDVDDYLLFSSHFLKILENAYNALHLFFICIFPYTVELFCYASMIILMKRFHSDGNNENRRRKRLCCLQRMSNIYQNFNGDNSVMDDRFSKEKQCSRKKLIVTDNFLLDKNESQKEERFICLERMSIFKLLTRPRNRLSRSEAIDRRSSVAWRNTVALARRKTLRKAFIMLTLNMIFWTPYCVIGILSTFIVFDHSSYDFLNALVVLNAVSNLLL